MLQRVNKQLDKIMPFITPTSVVLGVLLSAYLKEYAFLIPWIFAFMTFSGSLNSNFHSLREAFVSPIPILFCLLLLHVLMPVWSWGMGHVFFSGDVYTITGLTLGMAIPTGITSMIWVSIYRGNVATTLSIILLDTLLSPILVPYTLSIMISQ
ncbi:MAG: bile acid:sodium symporter family protein, partial [Bacillota bacterium]|nr:bile acid:sodium symporter family protein [Bacillota bacterium]